MDVLTLIQAGDDTAACDAAILSYVQDDYGFCRTLPKACPATMIDGRSSLTAVGVCVGKVHF